MFCPLCKAEYRPGFTHCNDCDVDLVEALPEDEADAAPPPETEDRAVWSGADQGECSLLCDRLEQAGIPFQVVRQEEGFFYGGAGERLEVRVPEDAAERAQAVLDELTQELADRESGKTEMPELDALELSEDDDDDAEPLERDVHRDPRNWQPEDASEQVWAGDDPEQARMIEVSLREHRIYSRTDVLDDGSQQVLVIPEHQARARAIVREIVEGRPL